VEIAEFIAARLAEDEAEANPAVCGCLDANHIPYCVPKPHLERPRRELAAKRAIVELHDRVHDCPVIVPTGNPAAFPGTLGYVSTEHVDEGTVLRVCTTLREVAAVYSDHPDYRAEWKPC
jgi:hypothetical protein